jgi:hypothetical protein
MTRKKRKSTKVDNCHPLSVTFSDAESATRSNSASRIKKSNSVDVDSWVGRNLTCSSNSVAKPDKTIPVLLAKLEGEPYPTLREMEQMHAEVPDRTLADPPW